MNLLKKYTYIKQREITDCVAACLATISKQYGLKIPITKIREVLGTDKSKWSRNVSEILFSIITYS